MSHVIEVDLEINSLTALIPAAERCGLEFVEGQTSYRWYGHHVGDYPLPKGFTAADMGKCLHALRVKGNPQAYEVGVVARRDGKPGYTLLFDFFAGGYGLEKAIGVRAERLHNHYGAQVAKARMQKKGYRVEITEDAETQEVLTVCTK